MRGAALLVPAMPFLLGVALSVAAAGAIEPFPLADLRPGMRGFALTVLEGEEPDTFAVEIVGVTAGSGPGQHLILVKALDERIARTGIAAGMSGSPVFIDGRIAAALAYAYVGATEPIGAAVPFEEMSRGLEWSFERDGAEEPRSRRGAGHGLPPFPEWREREAAGAGAGCGPQGGGAQPAWPPAGMPAPREPAGMRRLDLPMAVGGALGGAAASERSWWDERGIALLPALGGGAGDGAVRSAARAGRAALLPGDAIAIDLISGDMAASAIGTVTWSEGDRVLALGHGFLTALPIEIPVSRARIHAIIATRGVSFKIGAPVEEVGTLIADREPGVAVRLGRTAPRIPFSLRLRSGSGAFPEQAFDFSVARNEILSPALIALAARSAVTVYGYGLGAGTMASRLEILFDDGRRLAREDLLRTLSPGQAVGEALSPVSYVSASDFAPFAVRAVSIDLTLDPDIRAAEVLEVQAESSVRPGGTVEARIRVRHHRGAEEVLRVRLPVPEAFFEDELVVMAGSPLAFYNWDRERAPGKYVPRSFDHLLELLADYPSDEMLIVRLFGPARGAVHRDRELSALPLSKWGAMTEARGGGILAVAGMTVAEVRVPTGEVVVGGAFTTVAVKP